MVIGAIWYSPVLFGNVWMRLVGLKPEKMKPAAGPMIGTVVMTIISSYLLAVLIQLAGATTALEGFVIALLLGIVISAKTSSLTRSPSL
jgi:preprotein translocase subunit SecF